MSDFLKGSSDDGSEYEYDHASADIELWIPEVLSTTDDAFRKIVAENLDLELEKIDLQRVQRVHRTRHGNVEGTIIYCTYTK